MAWVEGAISGVVTLDCDTPQNQPHRAAEEAARAAKRTLLTLDTRAGDAGEVLYRMLGYTEAGRFPGYALNPDRTTLHDTVLFYKRLTPPG